MPWIEVNGTDIYYQEEGAGEPMVFLHGMSSCGEAWWQQFAHFRDRFRCISYDSVNHGHSSNSPREEEEPDRADELEGFLAAMGIERPILAGNIDGREHADALGGAPPRRCAGAHPFRRRRDAAGPAGSDAAPSAAARSGMCSSCLSAIR